jgi:hypothetical protein
MKTFVRLTGVLALLFHAATVAAQDRLFVGDMELGAFGRFGERIGTAPLAAGSVLIGGARYAKVSDTTVIDTRTGAVVWSSPMQIIAVDPVLSRVFVWDASGPVSKVDVPAGAVTPLLTALPFTVNVFGPRAVSPQARYAPGTGELFVRRQNAAGTAPELAVVETSTATLRRILPDLDPTAVVVSVLNTWLVTADGARLAAVTLLKPLPQHLWVADAATGAEVGRTVVLPSVLLQEDHVFQRLLFSDGSFGGLSAFDRSGQLLGTYPTPYSCGVSRVAVSPHTDRIYLLLNKGGAGTTRPPDYYLTVLDGRNGALIAETSLRPLLTERGCGPAIQVVTAPGPPRDLRATVQGSTVDLSWVNVGDASNFVLDAGFQPGRTNLSIPLGVATRATFTGVPPGTYYLRVRGGNAIGGGRPSAEVTLVVR